MKKIISICLLAAFALTGCEKDSEDPSILGLWVGTYQPTSAHETPNSLYYSFTIQSDNVILVQGLGNDGNTYYAKGTWSLSGSNFAATITTLNLSQAGVVQNVTAKYSASNRKLTSGTVDNANGLFSGVFTLEKVN